MITKYCSIYKVISKVFADLDLKEEDHRINDMITWSAEALEKIGAFPYFNVETTGKDGRPLLQLTDYQCQLPMGCHNVLQIAYAKTANGPFYPMRSGTSTMDFNKVLTNQDTTNTDIVFSDNDLIATAMSLYDLSYEDAQAKLNSEPDTKTLISVMLNTGQHGNIAAQGGIVETNDYTYVINGGYVKCNQRDGYLMVIFQAIPLDDDGYPLIPDNASFFEAVYWYIVMKMYYPQWKQGTIRDAVYYDARRSWNYYSKQAYGNALMPNYDEMESIKNTWLRLIPDLDSHKTFYTRQGQREQVYNQDSPRYNSYYEKVFYK